MKFNFTLLAFLGIFFFTSCGSPPRRRSKKKKKTTPPPVTAQAPVADEKPKGFAAKMSSGGAEEPKKVAAAPVKEPVKTKTPAPNAGGSKASFPNDYIAGKTLSEWFRDLDSKETEKVVEACGVLELAGKKASSASPKLEALSKNANKEIAEAAKAALKKVK